MGRATPALCVLVAAATLQPPASAAGDVAFDDDIVATFLEYAETPLKKIKQTGPHKSPKHPVRNIRQSDKGAAQDKPFMMFITAPGCGACNRLKMSVNRGTAVRKLLSQFHTVYLNGPGGMPWTDKWNELGHEGYIPQVYFYDRSGRHLNVINVGKDSWNWHSFTSEDALLPAMQEAISRDARIAGGEDFDSVLGIEKKPPPPPPPPPPGMNEFGCMEGWAGADCDECAPGWGGEDCDIAPATDAPSTNEFGCLEGWAGADCDECAPGWGGEDCDVPPTQAEVKTNEFGCMEGWAGNDCDECAPGWGGEDCDQKVQAKPPPSPPKPPPAPPVVARHTDFNNCEECVAAGFGWSIKKGRCGGFSNKRCPEL